MHYFHYHTAQKITPSAQGLEFSLWAICTNEERGKGWEISYIIGLPLDLATRRKFQRDQK